MNQQHAASNCVPIEVCTFHARAELGKGLTNPAKNKEHKGCGTRTSMQNPPTSQPASQNQAHNQKNAAFPRKRSFSSHDEPPRTALDGSC